MFSLTKNRVKMAVVNSSLTNNIFYWFCSTKIGNDFKLLTLHFLTILQRLNLLLLWGQLLLLLRRRRWIAGQWNSNLSRRIQLHLLPFVILPLKVWTQVKLKIHRISRSYIKYKIKMKFLKLRLLSSKSYRIYGFRIYGFIFIIILYVLCVFL